APMRAIMNRHARRIDAIARDQLFAEIEIGGRIAEHPPALVAFLHDAGHRMPAAELGRGVAAAPLADLSADCCRSELAFLIADHLVHGKAETMGGAHRLQQSGIAPPILAEAEIGADDEMANTKPLDQYIPDKILGRHRSKRPVKIQ